MKPPPPPRRAQPAAPNAMSEGQKARIAVEALGLLNEQIEARIVHYKADLETSPELDAITAQVVSQLRAMQAALPTKTEAARSPDDIEAKQTKTLTQLLSRVFNRESQFPSHVLKPVGRRVAKLFFESELHEKTKGDKEKRIFHAEQALYYVLGRYRNRLRAELEGFDYDSAEVREATFELLAKTERDLQVGFLSRRSPELNRVMTIFATVFADFLSEHLPPRLEQLAKMTIRAGKTARRPNSLPYKVLADAFPSFRHEWERLAVEQMVFYCGDELLARLTYDGGEFREETVKFFSDPHVFSESCAVLCSELYEFLCLEGFLDLPVDWRVSLEAAE
jgi:hypothetical protein